MDAEARYLDFSRRLGKVCDEHVECPPLHKGRLVWLKEQMLKEGEAVSVESVRKWLSGDMRPRDQKLEALSKVLGVESIWLRSGKRVHLECFEKSVDLSSASTSSIQIGIRPGLSVEIINIPLNLKKSEANKLANVILALADE